MPLLLACADTQWHIMPMCGRLAVTLPHDAMAQMFAAQPANNLPPDVNYNLCPTDQIAVVTGGDARRYMSMRWGFVPHWYVTENDGPLLINARAETLAEKPAFREACRARRCLIPVTGWYEWNKDEAGNRLPWYFWPTDKAPAVLAGIWQTRSDGSNSCAIVTVPANASLSEVHHRMPVTLLPDQWGLWLGEEGHGAARLMQPAPDSRFLMHRVRPEVNSNKAGGAQLILPLEQ